MSKVIDRPAHRSRKAGARHVVGVAGRPLKLARSKDHRRHAERQRPPLRERLAARVKEQTRRLDAPDTMSASAIVRRLPRQFRQAILPNDPRDAERRDQSGEPVVALVGAVDLVMLLAVAVLLAIGTVMVYSASLVYAFTNTASFSYYLIRQAEWLLVGVAGMYIAMRLDYHRWRLLAGAGLLMSALLLLLLHTHLGYSVNGSRRWLRFTSLMMVEPSEVAKMGLILYAAHWFAGQRPHLRQALRGLLPFGMVVGAVIWLVYKEPDLGTTAVIAVSLFMVYFVAGARPWHLAALAVVGVVGYKYLLPHLLLGYQTSRWTAFQNPWADPLGAGYHYVQLLDALGMGGTTGVGLGNSQAKFTMPEPHTDSIFAILGEEWGIVGTIGVLCLFILFALRGMRASVLAPDLFGRLLAVGLTGTIVFQALLNMSVVAHLMPFTGIPLPFISYGGSSLSISMVATGILLNISKQAVDLKEDRSSAPAYFWWRNRRPHLSVAGRGGTPIMRPALDAQRPAIGARRSGGR